MNTIADKWRAYEAKVIPAKAPEMQRFEMKKGFYGGAFAVLSLQLEMGDISADAGAAMMQFWYEECIAFAKDR